MIKRQFKKIIFTVLFFGLHFQLYSETRTIHVFVALCDNENQGIVRVPQSLGNGQNPNTNLYWGAFFGVRTFFNQSNNWTLVRTMKKSADHILERIVFQHKTQNVFLLADAYDGAAIKPTILDFLNACSSNHQVEIEIGGDTLSFGGNSNLLVYIGHNGLMDFSLNESFQPKDQKRKQAVILACMSQHYFRPFLRQTNAEPLIWTTGLMAPEAYTLEWAIEEWILNKTDEQIRQRAAEAYHHYQKCGINAANRLIVSGW